MADIDEAPFFPVPEMFEPKGSEPLSRDDGNLDLDLPEDAASRWILELMTAQNDLSISLKLLGSFSEAPPPRDALHGAYRNSHYLFFMRLLIGQVCEAWITFNQKNRINSSLINKITATDTVKALHGEVRDLLSKKIDGTTPLELAEKIRLSVFHFSDKDAGGWVAEMKAIGSGTIFGLTKSGLAVDRRWIIADQFVFARLRQAGIGHPELFGPGVILWSAERSRRLRKPCPTKTKPNLVET
jgi:hypothetical protein